MYKRVFSGPYEFLAIDGPAMYRRCKDQVLEGSLLSGAGIVLHSTAKCSEDDSGCDSEFSLSDGPSPELTLDGYSAMTRKMSGFSISPYL